MEKNSLKGIVDKITYRNSDNGYTVFKIKADKEFVSCVGLVPLLNEGDIVSLEGNYSNHAVYGEQFNVTSLEIEPPKTKLQVLKYLSSGAIRGIGPATALKIVERFKDDTLNIIENNPLELTVIKGISEDKARMIGEEYKKQYGIKDIMLELSSYNITPIEASNIFGTFGVNSIEIIKDNPFLLCNESVGFPFERAEEIAQSLGIPNDSVGRISAGIEYILRKNLQNGHTCLPVEKLILVAENFLSVNRIMVEDTIKQMNDSMQIVVKTYDNEVYAFLYDYYSAEEYIASKLRAYTLNNVPLYPLSEIEIKFIESKLGFPFDEKQIEATQMAMSNNVFVLTGGPGTGKTTTLNAIISILEGRGKSITLAAPTGRAAKRITELTGYEAKTLHRLLEVEWTKGGKQTFARNKKRPLDEDVIIVDETSMVDVLLFKALLEATRITSRIIIVGDSDQLPSVGAGNILGDIIASNAVCSVKLEKIFRQSDTSDIVSNAHRVITGEFPIISKESKDFFMIHSNNPTVVSETIVDLVSRRLPTAYGYSSTENIQVLCPSKKNDCGSHNLNLLLQQSLNPETKNTKQIFYKGIFFRIGDKVMQIKNDYDIIWTADNGEVGTGVFNGDIGIISDIDVKNKILTVKFDDKSATYYEENLEILELAYAITVHKSQGSEFDAVVIPLCDTPKLLRYRNLIYTAITRAKKLLVFVGNDTVLAEMIENDRKTLRYTALKMMLMNYDK